MGLGTGRRGIRRRKYGGRLTAISVTAILARVIAMFAIWADMDTVNRLTSIAICMFTLAILTRGMRWQARTFGCSSFPV